MSERPDVIVQIHGKLTERQAAQLKERFAAAMASPRYARSAQRAIRRLLPRRVRLRLWYARRVDGIAIRLCDRGWFDAAESLWRITGLWSAK